MITLADVATPDPASFAAGWGTLSLVNAGLAQSKGRSGLLVAVLAVARADRDFPDRDPAESSHGSRGRDRPPDDKVMPRA